MGDAAQISATPRTNTRAGKIAALDGVRGIAILAVLAFHLNGQVQYRFQNRVPREALTRAVLSFSNYGGTGVDLFFVLSGFLITGILVDARSSPKYYGAFYARRALRIFPLYFGFLALCLLVIPAAIPATVQSATTGYASAVDHQWYLWTLWTYCSNVGIAFNGITFGPLGHFWSLAVEEHFYLLWPFVVRASPPNRLSWICWLCVLVGVATRLGFHLAGHPQAAHMLMPGCLDAFGLGGIAAVAARRALDVERNRRFGRSLLAGSAGLALVVAMGHTLGGRFGEILEISFQSTLFAAVSATLIWIAATNGRRNVIIRLLTVRPLRAMGKYSYGLYVLHVPMIPILFGVLQRLMRAVHWTNTSELVSIVAFDFFGAACIVAAAMTSWHFFEKHFLKLKSRFEYTQQEPTAGGAHANDAASG
jgi:peptidoglycan/LPS O-acetylase OafA/YrhL